MIEKIFSLTCHTRVTDVLTANRPNTPFIEATRLLSACMYLQQDAWTIRILSDENSDDEPENLCVHMQSRVLADIEGERLSMSSRVFYTPACEA